MKKDPADQLAALRQQLPTLTESVESAQARLDHDLLEGADTRQSHAQLKHAIDARLQVEQLIKSITDAQDRRTHQRNVESALIQHRTEIRELRELLNRYEFDLEAQV